jgi:superfamily II RNA helicase
MKAQKRANNTDGKSNTSSVNKFKDFCTQLQVIIDKELLPCIVFCFSKATCSDLAAKLVEMNYDFNTGEEKGKVKDFLKVKL